MLSAVNTQRVDGRYLVSSMTAREAIKDDRCGKSFRANAIQGSAMLRDAILRAKGLLPHQEKPEPFVVERPKVIVVPKFRHRKCKRGRPKGSRNKKPSPRDIRRVRNSATIGQIQAIVAQHFDITISNLTGASKKWKYAHPRQIAMYAARKTTAASFPDIAKQFGKRDHTTVLHAFREVETRLEEGDVKTIRAMHLIRREIGA